MLPYIHAIVNEVLQWRPVTAGGVLHAVTNDDEQMDFHIPNGATVVGSHRSISTDKKMFDERYGFRPERWMKIPALPRARIRVRVARYRGQHVARNSLFIIVARFL